MIEKTILRNLLKNEEYARKTLPFLSDEYFFDDSDKKIFLSIKEFIVKYGNLPTIESLDIDIKSTYGLSDKVIESVDITLNDFKSSMTTTEPNLQWLVDHTEQFCQDKSLYNAIMKSIEIMKNENGSASKGSIPKILSDALSVSFDPHIGHDYIDQYEDRYEYYHRVLERIPFDLEFMNKITKNGLPKKTLNIILAGCVHPSTKVKIRFRKRISNRQIEKIDNDE